MTWEEYYARFYDWAESTQARYLSKLTTLGPADEVAEIIIELQVNVPAADRLLRKAVEAKLAFSASDLIEFLCINNKELAVAAVFNSAKRFTAEDMEFLYGEVDDEVIIHICSQQKLPLPEDLREEEYVDDSDEDLEDFEDDTDADCPEEIEAEVEAKPKIGFWGGLALLLGLSGHSHGGGNRCDGDCANCPAHYGYRYGRWYYGHGHQHGCERGGNGGASGRTYRD